MTASLLCTKGTVQQVKEYAKQLQILVCLYQWITESYVVEFFVKDLWDRLPLSWQHPLASLVPHDVAEVIFNIPSSTSARLNNQPSPVWPLTLLAFRAATLTLALRRTVDQPARLHPQSGRNPDLSHCYRAHVKPKKQHEIERLAEVIDTTCEQAGCCRVVDVGSGQGHLSRLLSFGYNHQVTSIEAVDCHVTGAAKFDQEVQTYFERKAKAKGAIESDGISPPHHVVCTVHPYITVEEFLSVVSAHTQSNHADGKSHSVTRVEHMPGKRVHKVKKMKMACADSDTLQDGGMSKVENSGQRIIDTGQSDPGVSISDQSHPSTFQVSTSTLCKTHVSIQSTGPVSCQEYVTTQTDQGHDPPGNHSQSEKFLITGLHTCGDLGPTMLRTFSECPQSVALASVACCYMRMAFCDKSQLELRHTSTTLSSDDAAFAANTSSLNHPCSRNSKQDSSEDLQGEHLDGNIASPRSLSKGQSASGLDVGFPMSSHIQSLCKEDGSMLTFEPLELACHFVEGYQARLKADDPSLLTQGYRAALEVLIQEQCVDLNQSQEGARRIRKAVSSVKRAHLLSFQDYASAILGKLGLQSDSDRIRTIHDTVLPRWHNLVTYHSIRQLLAPIVESLVLVDRALFLLEKGIESSLVPIFDPLLSPRNLVLLAIKKSS